MQLSNYLINNSVTYFSEDLVILNVIPDSPIYMYETPYHTISV